MQMRMIVNCMFERYHSNLQTRMILKKIISGQKERQLMNRIITGVSALLLTVVPHFALAKCNIEQLATSPEEKLPCRQMKSVTIFGAAHRPGMLQAAPDDQKQPVFELVKTWVTAARAPK